MSRTYANNIRFRDNLANKRKNSNYTAPQSRQKPPGHGKVNLELHSHNKINLGLRSYKDVPTARKIMASPA